MEQIVPFVTDIQQHHLSRIAKSNRDDIQKLAKQLECVLFDVHLEPLTAQRQDRLDKLLKFFKYNVPVNTSCVTMVFDTLTSDTISINHVITQCVAQCESILRTDELMREMRKELLVIWKKLEHCRCIFEHKPVKQLDQLGIGAYCYVHLCELGEQLVAVKTFAGNMTLYDVAAEVYNAKYVKLHIIT